MQADTMKPNRIDGILKQSGVRSRVLTSPAQLAGYDADGLGYKTFRPDAVVIPTDGWGHCSYVGVAQRPNDQHGRILV